MFICSLDKDFSNKLKAKGYKLLKSNKGEDLFVFDKKIKFDFSNQDKAKFLFTNKLTF